MNFTTYAARVIKDATKDAPAYDLPLDLARHVRKAIENFGYEKHEVGAYRLYYDLSHRPPTAGERANGAWWEMKEWQHLSYFTFKKILEGFGITTRLASTGRTRDVFAVRDLDGELLPKWAALFDALDRYGYESVPVTE